MKKVVINICKVIFVYILFYILLNLVCALIIKQFLNESYLELIISLICNNTLFGEPQKNFLNIVVALKSLIEGIALAILTSFIFTYILNKEVKIIFSDKIVLRRRTSEGSKGKLTLGILIGNPGKKWLYDVKCNINCTYIKQIGDIIQVNGETNLNQMVEVIKNYYRFSFEFQNLPKVFWQHYLERNENYVEKDYLLVTITGKKEMGGYFRNTKKYYIQDIIIDNHDPEKYFKRKTRNQERTKINWKKFPKCIEAGENGRKDIVGELESFSNEV